DAGVAVMAHLGLRPQSVGLLGGYRFQGRTSEQADLIVSTAMQMQNAGAAALLIEAVPPEVSEAVVRATNIPVIGCGAGPACHGSVIVMHDALSLSPRRPRFVPQLAELNRPMISAFADYVRRVSSGQYPAAEHQYEMPAEERSKFTSKRTAARPA
ncbi:MAG TPA: 3-methyl-2-oxobutanoate hydroxymethyltransferase, partial [Tepidisphaeraceae bacterium]|nr:3-methyl-2-oxobutanoate hydroxymethyltransferase [Tepidisphaeraceae bacterium]